MVMVYVHRNILEIKSTQSVNYIAGLVYQPDIDHMSFLFFCRGIWDVFSEGTERRGEMG